MSAPKCRRTPPCPQKGLCVTCEFPPKFHAGDRAAGEGAPLAGKGPAQAGGVVGSTIPDGNHGDNLKPTQDRRTAVTVLDVIAAVGFVDAVSTLAGVVCGVGLGVSLVGAVVA